jgi:hypothetical protein
MSRHFKIFLCVLGLFAVALLFTNFSFRGNPGQDSDAARYLCGSFLNHLIGSRFKEAHALLSPQQQSAISVRSLKRLWMKREKKHGYAQSWGTPHTSMNSGIYKSGFWGKQPERLKLTLRLLPARPVPDYDPGAGIVEFTCVKEDGKWSIQLFNFP